MYHRDYRCYRGDRGYRCGALHGVAGLVLYAPFSVVFLYEPVAGVGCVREFHVMLRSDYEEGGAVGRLDDAIYAREGEDVVEVTA